MSASASGRPVIPTILLVHRDTRLCELLQLALGNGGFDMCIAMDAEDAMSQFRRHNPDLVVLDVAIAAESGPEFCRLLKGTNTGRRVPLFVLSEAPPATAIPQAAEIGADECLTRPFSAPEVLMKVRRTLERFEEQRALEAARSRLEKSHRRVQADFDALRRELIDEKGGVQSIIDFNQRIDPGLDRSDVERRSLLQVIALFRVTGACFFRAKDDPEWIVPERWHGLIEARIAGARLPASGEFLRILAAAGRPLRIEEFEQVPGTSWEAGVLSAAGFTLLAPLIVRGELTGVLALTDRPGADPFTGPDVELLGLFASSLAHLLDRARARDGDRQRFIASLRELVELSEKRHPFLMGHSRRVAAIAAAIAKYLGLPEAARHEISLAGLLHDVGEFALDPVILGRPAPLAAVEWMDVRRHPVDGADVARSAGLSEDVCAAIRHHHEYWRGGGYPAGFKGTDIPFFARILGVADCYDAMLSPRPWRGALARADVTHYLASQSGFRYDPRVIDAILCLVVQSPALDMAGSAGSSTPSAS